MPTRCRQLWRTVCLSIFVFFAWRLTPLNSGLRPSRVRQIVTCSAELHASVPTSGGDMFGYWCRLGQDSELHHPVRDGRPPILLSKKGHALIEDQLASVGDDPIGRVLWALKRERNRSWLQLRRGCLDWLGQPVPWPSNASAAGARGFAKKAAIAAAVGYEQILEWMDNKGLGL